MKDDAVVIIDEPVVIVRRAWFDHVVEILDGKHGCPFCGSTSEPVRQRGGGVPDRVGCGDCNRWFR